MICFCPTCGLVFEDNFISGSAGSRIEVNPYRIQCPNGHWANALGGNFTWDKNGLQQFLSGPAFSKNVLEQLHDLAKSYQNKDVTPEEFAKAADKILPGIGARLLDFIKAQNGAIFVGIFLLLLEQIFFSNPTVINNTVNIEYKINPHSTKAVDSTAVDYEQEQPKLKKSTFKNKSYKKYDRRRK